MKLELAAHLIQDEAKKAILKHRPFQSPHEGYAVIKEELDELWEEIHKLRNFDERSEELKEEAIQCGAMLLRFLMDLM